MASDGDWFWPLAGAGLLAWFAYDKWWKEDDLPRPPLPIVSQRPTGLIKLGTDKDGTVRFLDADSVAGDRGKRRGWIISHHDKDKTVPQRETKEMLLADCDEGSYKIPSIVTYGKDDEVIFSWDESEDDQARIYHPAPGTIGETNFSAICRDAFDPPKDVPPPVTK